MPRFTFTADAPRYFHDFGDLEPGAVVEAPDNPDPLWFAPANKKPAPADTTTAEKE